MRVVHLSYTQVLQLGRRSQSTNLTLRVSGSRYLDVMCFGFNVLSMRVLLGQFGPTYLICRYLDPLRHSPEAFHLTTWLQAATRVAAGLLTHVVRSCQQPVVISPELPRLPEHSLGLVFHMFAILSLLHGVTILLFFRLTRCMQPEATLRLEIASALIGEHLKVRECSTH